ncbi:MAG: hypothetical protein V2G48_07415 [bacterium JZ-2024 1]
MTSRIGAFFAAALIFLFFALSIRLLTKTHQEKNPPPPAQLSLSGGIFAFGEFLPHYPKLGTFRALAEPSQISLTLIDPAILTTLPAQPSFSWNIPVLSLPLFTFVVDYYHLEDGFEYKWETYRLTISFNQDTLLTPGEHIITLYIYDQETRKTGYTSFTINVENPLVSDYRKKITGGFLNLKPFLSASCSSSPWVNSTMAYFLLPAQYGEIRKKQLKEKLEEIKEGWKKSPVNCWKEATGKEVGEFEFRLALRIFENNWERILKTIPYENLVVSPFISRKDFEGKAERILKMYSPKKEGEN